jgi:hypothetical protein
MSADLAKLQAAEGELKQLMAEVTRAVAKAQEAVAKVTAKPAAAAPANQPSASPQQGG